MGYISLHSTVARDVRLLRFTQLLDFDERRDALGWLVDFMLWAVENVDRRGFVSNVGPKEIAHAFGASEEFGKLLLDALFASEIIGCIDENNFFIYGWGNDDDDDEALIERG